MHTSKAVQSLLSESVPLDVVLLTSATLGILDLFNGQWQTACTHVMSGAKMAKAARSDRTSDPFISFYCEAFASALPSILKRAADGEDQCPPEKNAVVRLDEAVRSLKLARTSFDEAIPRVEAHHSTDKDRILILLKYAKAETEWILQRWEALLREELQRTSPPDDELRVNIHRVESPWSHVMADLNTYLDEGGHFDAAKFEVAMERTLPFYMLAKSGPNVRMREVAAELLYLGAQMRGRMLQNLPQSPHIAGRVIETDDGG